MPHPVIICGDHSCSLFFLEIFTHSMQYKWHDLHRVITNSPVLGIITLKVNVLGFTQMWIFQNFQLFICVLNVKTPFTSEPPFQLRRITSTLIRFINQELCIYMSKSCCIAVITGVPIFSILLWCKYLSHVQTLKLAYHNILPYCYDCFTISS